jgi:exonuclease III
MASPHIEFALTQIAPDFQHIAVDSNDRSAGVAILARQDIEVVNSGSVSQGRIVWIKIKYAHSSFSIANVYAHNDAPSRTALWELMEQGLPHDHWIILGDYNMIEKVDDSTSRSPLMGPTECSRIHSNKRTAIHKERDK